MKYKAREVVGYYEKTVEVEVDRKLSKMPYAQCGVRFDTHGCIEFVSYSITVIEIDPLGWMTCTGTYSQTTRKQIGKFLSEYAPKMSYYDAKRCYEKNMAINIHTGEVKSLD